jgi:hypothetical protein
MMRDSELIDLNRSNNIPCISDINFLVQRWNIYQKLPEMLSIRAKVSFMLSL